MIFFKYTSYLKCTYVLNPPHLIFFLIFQEIKNFKSNIITHLNVQTKKDGQLLNFYYPVVNLVKNVWMWTLLMRLFSF